MPAERGPEREDAIAKGEGLARDGHAPQFVDAADGEVVFHPLCDSPCPAVCFELHTEAKTDDRGDPYEEILDFGMSSFCDNCCG